MSNEILHKNRNGCALHGALKVVNAIDGLVPIIHSTAGCSIQSKQSENFLTGNNGLFHRGWREVPATAVFEKQVVFGGSSRLREQIKNTVKVQAADLYVVVSGCAPELVGDDVPAMVKEGQDQNFPVISVLTPGFKGNVYKGYEWAVKSILDRIAFKTIDFTKQKGLVNILGVVPNQDIFWEGNLEEIRKILSQIGLQANTLLGYDQSKENWKKVPNAELNVVVSPWGLEAAKQLETKFGTPYLYLGYIPVGSPDTSKFIELLGEKLKVSKELIEKVISENEKQLTYQLSKLAQTYLSFDFQKEIALVGETSNVLGISRFLQESFGQIVTTVIITDEPEIELRQQIKDTLPVNASFDTHVIFSSNGKEIDDVLRNAKPQLILGSSLEQNVAKELSVPLIKIASPVYDSLFLNLTYSGYSGAVNLLQDFSGAILKNIAHSKKKIYKSQSK